MRFVVFGAGAIGGVLGGRLAEHGNEVVLIARGEHAAVMQRSGLVVESPTGTVTVHPTVVTHPNEIDFRGDDVVLLATKSHDSRGALAALANHISTGTPIVCVQNGTENERTAARLFANVYGGCVMCPTTHLEPGVVQAFSTPTTGIIDVGRFPSGVDALTESIAATFTAATVDSIAQPDIMRWKYAKLLNNLGNSIEALCGPPVRDGELFSRVKREGEACLDAAGIAYTSDAQDAARRGDLLTLGRIHGEARGGGSTWQSLRRGAGSVETDYLNGEIVLLGRQFGVPTPANALLQRLAREQAVSGGPPASMSQDQILSLLT